MHRRIFSRTFAAGVGSLLLAVLPFTMEGKMTLTTWVLVAIGEIPLFNHEIPVPYVPRREEVDVHLILDAERGALEVRIWWDNRMVQLSPLK